MHTYRGVHFIGLTFLATEQNVKLKHGNLLIQLNRVAFRYLNKSTGIHT